MRLAAAVRSDESFKTTLAGARVEADAESLGFWREPGEAARGGLTPLRLASSEAIVWDGRFEITTQIPDLTIRRLAGTAARLPVSERRALAAVPAPARGALPLLIKDDGGVTCPALAPVEGVRFRALAKDRLQAACGAIEREPD